jgi:NADP-dependent 3-hydroxy acid dehydrogenase YdfG
MGMDWDPDVTGEMLAEWTRWGLARHSAFLRPEGVASAIVHAVALPRGTHLSVVEVQPEAPLSPLGTEGAP